MARFPANAITHFIIEPLNESLRLFSFRIILSFSLSGSFLPTLIRVYPTFASAVFALNTYNRIRDSQAKEASQREVVMVYILFHPVILANDKDGSSNKSRRRRRMLDTERTAKSNENFIPSGLPRLAAAIASFHRHKYGGKLPAGRKKEKQGTTRIYGRWNALSATRFLTLPPHLVSSTFENFLCLQPHLRFIFASVFFRASSEKTGVWINQIYWVISNFQNFYYSIFAIFTVFQWWKVQHM